MSRDALGRNLSGNAGARPDAAGRFSDAAHRMSDAVNSAIAHSKAGQWMVFTLDEARTNGRTYESRRAAVRDHGSNADRMIYTKIPLDSMPPNEAASWIQYNRWAIEQMGGRLPDPEKDRVVMPTKLETLPRNVRLAHRGLWTPGMN